MRALGVGSWAQGPPGGGAALPAPDTDAIPSGLGRNELLCPASQG